jgi:acetyl/propionyl-CoA carboxylase alpha subunit
MAERRTTTTIDGETSTVRVEPGAPGTYTVRVGDAEPVVARVLSDGATLTVLLGEQVLELAPSGEDFGARGGVVIGIATGRAGAGAHATTQGSGTVQAPMPGRIVKLLVGPGDTVAAGAGLLVMEAMKMENEIGAPHAGTVSRVLVRAGDTVERDAALVELSSP